MFRKEVILVAITLVPCANILSAAQIDSTWVGSGRNLWKTPTNWNPTIVPENGMNTFAVTIKQGVVGLTTDHSINSLDTYGTVKLKGVGGIEQPDITLTNNLTNHGFLKMVGPEIFGRVVNLCDATIMVSYEFNVFGPGGLHNFGTVVLGREQMWTEYDIENSNLIEMYNGMCDAQGNIINNATGTIRGSGFVGPESILIDNAGLIQSIYGTLSLLARSMSNTGCMRSSPGASIAVKAGLNNQGIIEINSNSAINFDSNFTNDPNGIVRLLGGTLAARNITQKTDADFTGFGGITGNVKIDPGAIVRLTGPTHIVGDVNIPAGATLEISDGQLLITGQTTCEGTVHLKGGSIVFQGGCDCDSWNVINEP